MKFNNEEIEFSTGRKDYCFSGFISIREGGEIAYGYDGSFSEDNWTSAERKELAEYMIDLWEKFGGLTANQDFSSDASKQLAEQMYSKDRVVETLSEKSLEEIVIELQKFKKECGAQIGIRPTKMQMPRYSDETDMEYCKRWLLARRLLESLD
jgi:hypothetical protein